MEDVSEVESGGARKLARQGAACKKGADKVKKVAKQGPGRAEVRFAFGLNKDRTRTKLGTVLKFKAIKRRASAERTREGPWDRKGPFRSQKTAERHMSDQGRLKVYGSGFRLRD